jgi:hypothetical protein
MDKLELTPELREVLEKSLSANYASIIKEKLETADRLQVENKQLRDLADKERKEKEEWKIAFDKINAQKSKFEELERKTEELRIKESNLELTMAKKEIELMKQNNGNILELNKIIFRNHVITENVIGNTNENGNYNSHNKTTTREISKADS